MKTDSTYLVIAIELLGLGGICIAYMLSSSEQCADGKLLISNGFIAGVLFSDVTRRITVIFAERHSKNRQL